MIFKEDKGTGYMYCYNPDHYCANKAGKVMEHVYVIAESIGRKLLSYECVHHKDRNKKNNNLNNLQLMTQSEHASLHLWEDKGLKAIFEDRDCKMCGNCFVTKQNSKRKYCTSKCSTQKNKKFEISKEELLKLVWDIPMTEISKKFGVSDVAIKKRCKKYGILTPTRGYWQKLRRTHES